MFDTLGTSELSVGGATIAALTWVWKKMSLNDRRMSALELKVAENYVTRPELKAVEDKIDLFRSEMGNKLDRVNDNLLILLQNKQ